MDVKQFIADLAKADFADALGLVVGEGVISLAWLRKRFRTVSLLATETRRFDVLTEGRVAAVVDLVRAFVGQHEIDSARLCVVLDRRDTFLGHLQLPTAAIDNLERVVSYELDRIIPVPSDQLYSGQVARPMGTVGERIAVTIVAGVKQRIEELQAGLAEAGFAPSSITALPVALSDYYAFCRGDQSGTAGIFVGCGDGKRENMTVSAQGMLVSSVRFDPASEDRIERVRRELEGSLPGCAEDPIEIIMEDGGPESSLAGLAPEGMLAAGRPLPWAAAAAIGAALSQLGEGRGSVNLLPPALVKVEEGIGLREMALAAVVVVMAVALTSTIALKNLSISNALAAEVSRLRPRVAAVTELEEHNREMLATVTALEKHHATSVLAYLKDMTARIPKTAYLTTFRYKGDRLELDGIADSAAGLISRLEESPYFKNVEFTAPTTKYLQNKERFSMRMELEQ